jgi:hypothetical protein
VRAAEVAEQDDVLTHTEAAALGCLGQRSGSCDVQDLATFHGFLQGTQQPLNLERCLPVFPTGREVLTLVVGERKTGLLLARSQRSSSSSGQRLVGGGAAAIVASNSPRSAAARAS